MTVTFPSVSDSYGSPYWILGTDYQNYAVVWSCSEWAGFASTRMVWILTRDKFPSKEVVTVAYDLLDFNGISKSFLMKTDHEGCDPMTGMGSDSANDDDEY